LPDIFDEAESVSLEFEDDIDEDIEVFPLPLLQLDLDASSDFTSAERICAGKDAQVSKIEDVNVTSVVGEDESLEEIASSDEIFFKVFTVIIGAR